MKTVQLLNPHSKDLGGGFVVRRLLPAAQRQAVGPFVFFDHFGPLDVPPEANHDVRPHPHIGLSTVTYLFEGAMLHRDSIGVVQRIEPGAVNWMTSGRGIVHSERTPDDLRGLPRRSHGLQLWVALPEAHEEDEPSFSHTAAADIPVHQAPGATVRVLVGEAFGLRSPVPALSPTLYLDIALQPGAFIDLAGPDDSVPEQALYGVSGPYEVSGMPVQPMVLAVMQGRGIVRLSAPERAAGPVQVALVGGQPLGHRHIWWNFVSSRRERIVQAADDWAAQRLGQVPGETEFIPLPERRPA